MGLLFQQNLSQTAYSRRRVLRSSSLLSYTWEMAENTRDAGNLESPSKEGEKMVRGIAAKPSLSWSHVREAQLEDDTLQWLVKAKEDGKSRPEWSEILHRPSSAKTYWSQ